LLAGGPTHVAGDSLALFVLDVFTNSQRDKRGNTNGCWFGASGIAALLARPSVTQFKRLNAADAPLWLTVYSVYVQGCVSCSTSMSPSESVFRLRWRGDGGIIFELNRSHIALGRCHVAVIPKLNQC
jgi:hypothetical protein